MKKFFSIIFLMLLLGVGFSSYFVVNEGEQVVLTRFGKPIRKPILDAGIYFKVPVVDTANFFDKRIMEWDGDVTNPIPTKDKKNIIVDTTARWRIKDPLKFMQTVGNEIGAQTRLDDIIDSNVRDVISKNDLIEIIRTSNRVIETLKSEQENEGFSGLQDQEILNNKIKVGREETTRLILKKSQPIIQNYGIELIDVRIKGVMYSTAVLDTVYQRMISQYGIKAQNLRSEGDKKKSEIEGQTELDIKKIRSEAYRKAQQIRGEGDAQAAKIYAEALQSDPDFYQFQKSLESYEQTITPNTTLVIGTDSQLFRILKSSGATAE